MEIQTNPLISVIVPVYNTERFLANCLGSILGQTYRNIELIVIDDGSQDRSLEIGLQFAAKDSRVIIVEQTNRGQARARNAGLNKMRGEYVLFVDSDDFIAPQAIEKLYNAIAENDADFAFTGMMYDNGMKKTPHLPYKDNRVFSTRELLEECALTSNIHTGVCNKLFAGRLLADARFPDARKNEDVVLLYQLIGRSKKIVYVNDILYTQNVRFGSVEKSRFSMNHLRLIDAEAYIISFYEAHCRELLPLVVDRKANAIAITMGKIFEDFAYIPYKNLFRRLRLELKEEYNAVIQSGVIEAFPASSPAYQMLNHPFRFCCARSWRGLKKWVILCCGMLLRKRSIRIESMTAAGEEAKRA